MDGSWEGGALSEDRESVAQVSHVVLGLHFVSVERFVTLTSNHQLSLPRNTRLFATYLERLGRVILGD